MQTSPIKAVVFDMDGLMFNTEDLYDEVGELLLQRRGHQFTSELKDKMLGRPGSVALQIMIDHHGLDATPAQLQAETDEIFQDLVPEKVATLPGLPELLNALESASIPKAVGTSSHRTYTQLVLSQFDYEPRFQFLLTAEDVTHGKPAPEIYQLAAKRFELSTSEILVLEDSENGCRAASTAGAFTVAVPNRHTKGHDFSGVNFIANGLTDERIYQAIGLNAPPQ